MPIELPAKLQNKTVAPDKLVLLLAVIERKHGPINANFKIMSEMSDGEYTESSLEHFFRDFKNAARALNNAKPEVTGRNSVPATPSKSTKKRKVVDSDDDEDGFGSEKQRVSASKRRAILKTKIAQEGNVNDDEDEKVKLEDWP